MAENNLSCLTEQETMWTLIPVTALCCVLAFANAQTFDSFFPRSKHCGLSYGKIFTKAPWVCEDSQFQEYPEPQISQFMKFKSVKDYLGVTESCYNYHDADFKGENEHYKYDSLCAKKRKPIHVIWAHVPGFKLTPELMALNGGKLPVHVVRGQSLFDIECIHPWARAQEIDALTTKDPTTPARRTGVHGIRFTGAKRHLCYLGYLYKRNYVCQPSGFVTQDLLVYSPHANTMFITRVADIPTSCSCTHCECATPTPLHDPWNGF